MGHFRERLTLAAFVDEIWAPRARRRLAQKDLGTRLDRLREARRPVLGELPIASIDIEALVEWQEGLEEAGVGAPTQIKAMGIVSSILREAARRPRMTGVIANPVALLEKPRARRRHRPLVWGPVVVEHVRLQLLARSRRIGTGQVPGRSARRASGQPDGDDRMPARRGSGPALGRHRRAHRDRPKAERPRCRRGHEDRSPARRSRSWPAASGSRRAAPGQSRLHGRVRLSHAGRRALGGDRLAELPHTPLPTRARAGRGGVDRVAVVPSRPERRS